MSSHVHWAETVLASGSMPSHSDPPPEGYRWATQRDGFAFGACCWCPVGLHSGTVSHYVLWRRPAVPV